MTPKPFCFNVRTMVRTMAVTASLQFAMLIMLAATGLAQIDPAAGILPFSTQGIGGADLASSQVTINIPIRSKNGIVPLNYSLVRGWHMFKQYDPSSGTWSWWLGGSSGDGQGLISSGLSIGSEIVNPCGSTISNVGVGDSTGAIHPFPTTFTINTCQTTSLGAVTTTDGSGYTLVVSNQQDDWWVYDKNGNYGNFVGGGGAGTRTVYTPDGVAYASAGIVGSGYSYTDALGTQLLDVVSGLYRLQTNNTYSYIDASGTTQTFTGEMYSPEFATDYGCAGIAEYKTVSGQDSGPWLPRSINTPTGGAYGIYYNGNGQIGKLTFPTGGSISYDYTGGNNGIHCCPVKTRTESVG